MLVELFDLITNCDVKEWTNTARWVKYEEHVEGVDHRWSRPHVSFLPFVALKELKNLFGQCVLVLEPSVIKFDDLRTLITAAITDQCHIHVDAARSIVRCFDVKKSKNQHPLSHPHLNHHHKLTRRSSRSFPIFSEVSYDPGADSASVVDDDTATRKRSRYSVRSVQEVGCEQVDDDMVSQVYTCHVKECDHIILILVRFPHAVHFAELNEHTTKVRFIYVVIGPAASNLHDFGRGLGILMSSQSFRDVATVAVSRQALVDAVQQVLNECVIVPLCEIDSKALLSVDNLRRTFRQTSSLDDFNNNDDQVLTPVTSRSDIGNGVGKQDPATANGNRVTKTQIAPEARPSDSVLYFPNPFERTGRSFGGVVNDIKYGLRVYVDDFKSAWNFQCFTSILFIFFANFANAVAIGEVMAESTDSWMGVSEILIAHALCGVVWGFVAGQPLAIMAAVGPFLVFEESLFAFCDKVDANFLSTRFWTGLWTFLFMTLLAMVEAPYLMKYLTRFTEDIFTALIAFIFIVAAGKFLFFEFEQHPLQNIFSYCNLFTHSNATKYSNNTFPKKDVHPENWWTPPNSTEHPGKIEQEIEKIRNQPDTALLSCIFFLATFVLAFLLKKLRMSIYFGRTIRRAFGDFGVPLAILVITLFDGFIFGNTYTQHVTMKETFDLTAPEKRDWIVNPLGTATNPLPIWMIPASVVPAVLVTILLYLEVEIIEALLAKKERGLCKPSGFHWDLIVCGALAFLCGMLGLQWMCPAAVQSLSHVGALTVMKRAAPGETARMDYVLEQRVTTIIIALLHAAAAFAGAVLKYIPTSALFGVFFYLGVMGLMGLQFWNRIILFFVPEKYFPDEPYCLNVSMRRMHLYTTLQIICLLILWSVNMFTVSALAFPFVLILLAVFRKYAFPLIFTQAELKALDGKPEDFEKNEIEEDDKDFYEQLSNHP